MVDLSKVQETKLENLANSAHGEFLSEYIVKLQDWISDTRNEITVDKAVECDVRRETEAMLGVLLQELTITKTPQKPKDNWE